MGGIAAWTAIDLLHAMAHVPVRPLVFVSLPSLRDVWYLAPWPTFAVGLLAAAFAGSAGLARRLLLGAVCGFSIAIGFFLIHAGYIPLYRGAFGFIFLGFGQLEEMEVLGQQLVVFGATSSLGALVWQALRRKQST